MQNELHERLATLLSTDEYEMSVFNLVEREGDVAFELLRGQLAALDSVRRARALPLLLSLTRQFCLPRLPDAIRTALLYTGSSDPEVRSAAVFAAARGSIALPAFPELRGLEPPPPSRAAVLDAISRAVALGVDDRARDEAARLSSHLDEQEA